MDKIVLVPQIYISGSRNNTFYDETKGKAMSGNIKKLLKKKRFTGEDVGKILIASLLNDIKHQGQNYELLLTQEEFDRIENSLNTERDLLAYGVYKDIYNSIVDTFNREKGIYQQFYNGYCRYAMYLKGAIQADRALADVELYPLIMTEKQYREVKEETLEHKKTFGESFYSLLFSLLEYFLRCAEDNNKACVPDAILNAIEASKKEKAKDQPILKSYYKILGEGYYQLEDGRRSDKLTPEEWEKAIAELYREKQDIKQDGDNNSQDEESLYNRQSVSHGWELYFNGERAIREEYRNVTGKELPMCKEGELLEALEEVINIESRHYSTLAEQLSEIFGKDEVNTEWHYYTDIPEGLTQYDLLETILISYSDNETDKKQLVKDFKKYFPEIYESLRDYIKEHVPKARSLSPTQYHKLFIGWGELAEAGIGNFGARLNPYDDEIIQYLKIKGLKFADIKRAMLSGIAIIRNPVKKQLDENGNYKENRDPLERFDNIDKIASDYNLRTEIENLQNNLFKPALRFLYCFNELLLIIGDIYGIDGIEVAKFATSLLEGWIKNFNTMLYQFHFCVYGDKEEKARKRKLIKEIFHPIDIESLKPSEKIVSNLKAGLSELGISAEAREQLQDFYGLINILGEGEC